MVQPGFRLLFTFVAVPLVMGLLPISVGGCGFFTAREESAHLSGTDPTLPTSQQVESASSPSLATNSPMTPPGANPGEAPSGVPTSLSFRTIVRDESGDLLIHAGETISLELEVKNEGPGKALGVEVQISGTSELVEHFPGSVPIGDIPAGEVKQASLTGKVGVVEEKKPAEFTLSIRTASPLKQLPPPKKFMVAIRPIDASTSLTATDVDEAPPGADKLKQPQAVGVAIGIGRFRADGIPRVKYAAQDAAAVAKYWNVVGGIPAQRVRQLVDAHALKSDLAEAFEDWLPRQVDPTSVVYVYVSGRGVVDPETGTISVIPFDGTATSTTRLYSLRHLEDILAKLPLERAIVMLDLSLEQVPMADRSHQVALLWDREGPGRDKIMWMIGNRAVQEAHSYDSARHGLFTYQLLRGWGGAADLDKNGTIIAGELCTFTKGRVATMAKEVFGNEQEPLCVPDLGQEALVRGQPMAKFN